MNGRKTAITVVLGLLLCSLAVPALAWDGSDENSNSVEIESGNLVRTGDDIEYYNYADDAYHEATVDSIERDGSEVIIDVTDDDTGYTHELTMEDDS